MKHLHRENYTRIQGNGGGCSRGVVTSCTGFDKGKHVWQIKGKEVHCSKRTGIVSEYINPKLKGTDNHHIYQNDGISFYYDGGGTLRRGQHVRSFLSKPHNVNTSKIRIIRMV